MLRISRKIIKEDIMEAKLSIIVPVYNTEKYLRQCVDSVLNQSLKDIEIILVDDGSSDKSGEICDEYSKLDARIQVIHQENRGLVCARKAGVERANSQYVVFVDADDFVEEKAYELALSEMENSVDIISFGIIRYFADYYTRIDVHRFKEGIYTRKEIEESIYPFMIWDTKSDNFGLDPSLCTKIIKRELIKKAYDKMGHHPFYYGEDSATLYPLLKDVQSIAIHNDAFYNHRQRGSEVQPEYIRSPLYFDRVFQLYTFLKGEFEGEIGLLEQIERFYIHSVQIKCKKEDNKNFMYLFPFDKVNKDSNIIIYGAGNVGKDYIKQLKQLNYCKVLLWVDGNYERLRDKRISAPQELYKLPYDKIVVAIENEDVKKGIKESLMQHGVLETDVV